MSMASENAGYYGLCQAQREHKLDIFGAQKLLKEMVASGAASWWPGRELIAVNRGEQGQLNLGAKSDDKA